MHDAVRGPPRHKVLTELGAKSGAFTTVVSDDLSNFNPDKIKDFDAIIFCHITSKHVPLDAAHVQWTVAVPPNGKTVLGFTVDLSM